MSIPYGEDSIWRKEGGEMDERKEKVEAKLTSLSPVPSWMSSMETSWDPNDSSMALPGEGSCCCC
jgi:hypothetical protein